MFASVSRQGRVSETIVRRIKKQISDGRLVAGHKLPAEREMARQFKTSRVSVREAYRSLEELGVLRIRRGADGGAFIAAVDHEPVLRSLALVLGLAKTSHKELTQARLLIEQLQHLTFEAMITKGHAEKMGAVNRLRVWCQRWRGDLFYSGWEVEHLCHLGALRIPTYVTAVRV